MKISTTNARGIYAEFGKIICIGVARYIENENGELVLRTKAFASDDEKSILQQFAAMVNKFDPRAHLDSAPHNGKEFDFPTCVVGCSSIVFRYHQR